VTAKENQPRRCDRGQRQFGRLQDVHPAIGLPPIYQ